MIGSSLVRKDIFAGTFGPDKKDNIKRSCKILMKPKGKEKLGIGTIKIFKILCLEFQLLAQSISTIKNTKPNYLLQNMKRIIDFHNAGEDLCKSNKLESHKKFKYSCCFWSWPVLKFLKRPPHTPGPVKQFLAELEKKMSNATGN